MKFRDVLARFDMFRDASEFQHASVFRQVLAFQILAHARSDYISSEMLYSRASGNTLLVFLSNPKESFRLFHVFKAM